MTSARNAPRASATPGDRARARHCVSGLFCVRDDPAEIAGCQLRRFCLAKFSKRFVRLLVRVVVLRLSITVLGLVGGAPGGTPRVADSSAAEISAEDDLEPQRSRRRNPRAQEARGSIRVNRQ